MVVEGKWADRMVELLCIVTVSKGTGYKWSVFIIRRLTAIDLSWQVSHSSPNEVKNNVADKNIDLRDPGPNTMLRIF
jgi:hypothetical protein